MSRFLPPPSVKCLPKICQDQDDLEYGCKWIKMDWINGLWMNGFIMDKMDGMMDEMLPPEVYIDSIFYT